MKNEAKTSKSRFWKGRYLVAGAIAAVPLAIFFRTGSSVRAVGPALIDPNLDVRTVVSGLQQPTSMAFLGANDFLVLEKAAGQVKRVIGGVIQSAPVLDLAVSSASARGLLGIAVHPDFPRNRGVYLYWTESTATNAAGQVIDSEDLSKTPLLGNRVDRFVWN